MHVVGLGDYKINDIQVIGDPCPEYKKDNDNEEEKKDKTKGDIMVGE
jgi:CRISPR/Cas system CSM-associated protein Csm3 (group 7 of RAMP superfamily)